MSLLLLVAETITHSGFNQKIITHILDTVFITRSHIFLSEIHLKFVVEFLVIILLIGRRSVGRWSVHLVGGGHLVSGRWSFGWWSVLGGRLVGGFKKTRLEMTEINSFWAVYVNIIRSSIDIARVKTIISINMQRAYNMQ